MKKIKNMILGMLLILLTACQSTSQTTTSVSDNQQVSEKITVTTTFYPVYYMTKMIAGDTANVTMLVSGNVDIHDFEPSAKNMTDIANSKLFIYSSDVMETWVKKVADSLKNSKNNFCSKWQRCDDDSIKFTAPTFTR